MPEPRAPPNGAARSRTKKQFTQTVPATSREPTRSARASSPVYTIAARPYSVEFASATASSSLSNVCSVSTGPKTSWVRISEPSGASANSVGR